MRPPHKWVWMWPAAMLVIGLLWTPAEAQKLPLPDIDPAASAELKGYLDAHHLSPTSYIVSKFEEHDVVFLGEAHCIRHDGLLVQELIPRLREVGVYTLVVEFARRVDQGRSVEVEEMTVHEFRDRHGRTLTGTHARSNCATRPFSQEGSPSDGADINFHHRSVAPWPCKSTSSPSLGVMRSTPSSSAFSAPCSTGSAHG